MTQVRHRVFIIICVSRECLQDTADVARDVLCMTRELESFAEQRLNSRLTKLFASKLNLKVK